MKRILIAIGLVVVASVSVLLITQQPAKAASKADGDGDNKNKEEKVMIYNVTTAAVQKKELRLFLQSTATLRADRQIDVFAKAPGQILSLNVEEGDHVKKGDVLIELDRENAQLELEQARVDLSKAQLEYDRIKESYAKKLVSAEEHDRRKFEFASAQSRFDLAAHKISLTQVVAPFNGTITARMVELGQTIQPSDKLFHLANLTPLEADVFVPESKATRLAEGQLAQLSRDDRFDDEFVGKVTRIAPVVDRETGTVKVTIAVSQVPKSVRPGTYVHVRIVTETMMADTALPKKAILFDSRQNASVFVVEAGENDGEFKVRRVDVALIAEEKGVVAIDSVLEFGQDVVLTGKEALKDGSLIKLTKES